MAERLQKLLAEAGIASRRRAEEYITQGRVSVNGEVITELGFKAEKTDRICFDNKEICFEEKLIYVLLNKPEGCVTSVSDDRNRKTVMDYIKDIPQRLYPVGRLDYDTSGLLLLTNDGDLTYKLTHPKHNIEKTYIARVDRTPTKEEIRRFEKGVMLDDRLTAPARLKVVREGERLTTLRITIHEGRNRQVRRMCEAINCSVKALKRISVGSLSLGEVKKGSYRYLTKEEIQYLKEL